MKYKLGNCICLQHPNRKGAREFYGGVLGLAINRDDRQELELDAAPFRLFLDEGEPREMIMELIVDNLDGARDELIAAGCIIVRWEGRGKCCYIRDPFGQMFNLWEDKSAF